MRGVGVAKRREGNRMINVPSSHSPKWLPEPERDRTAVDRQSLQSICLRERDALSTTARDARWRECEKGENKECRVGDSTRRNDYIFDRGTEGGVSSAGATLIVAVYYFNIRVRADIDVLSSIYFYPKYRKVLGVQNPFSKGFWKNPHTT